MDKDTDIGGPRGRFPATRHSVVEGVGSSDPQVRRHAFEALVDAYWKPVYKYVRIKWGEGNEDAKDLTQDFFALALEKGFFERYEPRRARFRTYLRTCLDGFVSNQRKAAKRQKRGGGTEMLSLDFEDAEGELRPYQISNGLDMEEYFHREWMRHLFASAVDALRQRCETSGKAVQFRLFERYDLLAGRNSLLPVVGTGARPARGARHVPQHPHAADSVSGSAATRHAAPAQRRRPAPARADLPHADPPDPRLHPDADPAHRFRPHLKKVRGTLNRRASTALNVGREERP